ncbi:MAG: thiamine-phosphate kinase, partial [Thermoplasmata archaeon]|nr:thiamine-phosphate kinase [Thermoplasmata archaeon]
LLPPDTPERWARAVAMGAEERLAEFGAHVVGGDTKPSGTRSVVGSLMGFGHANRLCPRSGARPGDWVVTTGVVGAGGVAMAGIRGNQSPARAALVRLLDVEPRVREGAALARHAHAMLDTSDGLAEAARLLADASGVGVVIDPDRLPLHPALARRTGSRQSKLGHAFFGGDYELLGTIPAQRVRRLQRTLGRLGCPLTVVGRVEAGHGAWLESGPDRRPMP